MKIPTTDLKERQWRQSRWAIKSAQKRNARKSGTRGKAPRWRRSSSIFKVPERLVYHAHRSVRNLFERFVVDITAALKRGENVEIDFRPIIRLYPCGLLLLMGMVDAWVAKYPGKLTAHYPKDNLAEQMLQHVGVLQKLGLEPRTQVEHHDVKRWHYLSGNNVDTGPFSVFMEEVQRLVGLEAQSGLGDCVAEAITNVKHHAYGVHEEATWWAFCTVSERKIFVAIHDRGSTIPGTLLAKYTAEDVVTGRLWAGRRRDGDLISAAMGGRTRTKLSHRGKGLPEMLAYTKANDKSELGIYSRSGFFQFLPLYSGERKGRLEWNVDGTLIMWMVNVPGEEV